MENPHVIFVAIQFSDMKSLRNHFRFIDLKGFTGSLDVGFEKEHFSFRTSQPPGPAEIINGEWCYILQSKMNDV